MTENNKTIINILIVFYTRYGNSARMADEISKGAKEIPEAHVAIKRIADDVFVSILGIYLLLVVLNHLFICYTTLEIAVHILITNY